MRLFVALDIDEEIRRRIMQFVEPMRFLAPQVRWVSSESLHITLKFIGERPDTMVNEIESALSQVSAPELQVSFRGCGFFPSANSARVFWVGLQAKSGLAELAAKVEEALATLGVPKEQRAFSPHLTLARAGSGAPGQRRGDRTNSLFTALQKRLDEISPPEFGTMLAREFFLYRSQLSSQGPRYSKIAHFALAGPES